MNKLNGKRILLNKAEDAFLIFKVKFMRKIFPALIIGLVIYFGFGIAFVSAASPNWDISGTWNLIFNAGGTPYSHTMNVTSFNTTTGEFIANGFYNTDPSYTWDATGTVSFDSITYHVVYTGTNAGYSFDANGTISADGLSMAGVWNSGGNSGTWTGTGQAIGLARLTVNKIVINDNGGTLGEDDFTLFIDGNQVTSGSSTTVIAGMHTVSETAVFGYTAEIGGDCDSDGNIIMSAGDEKVCTITNDDEPAHIIVQKTTLPAGDQTEFSITATGTGAILNGENGTVSDTVDYEYIVDAGIYFVSEVVPAGWEMLSNDCMEVAVNIGETATCEIINLKLGEIHGVKFEDLNGDGERSQDEPGLEGWKIYLDLNSDNTHNEDEPFVITDQNGFYSFVNLLPGTYIIREELQDGWSQTFPFNPDEYEVHLQAGDIVVDKNFGNFKWNLIEGYKWHDLNGDGIWQQPDEPPLENWPIELHKIISEDPEGRPIETELVSMSLTGSDGSFRLYAPGTAHWGIKEQGQEGWIETAPELSSFFDVFFDVFVTHSGQTHTTDDQQRPLYFGNFKLNKITGYKWEDKNGDGVWQEDELGIPNWKIILDGRDRNGNLVHQETLTDMNGQFSFFDVFVNFPGEAYKISEENKDNWIKTAPVDSFFDVFVELSGIEHTTDYNGTPLHFGNFRLGEIHGIKFEDSDRNGRKGAREPGLSGWIIQLTGFDEITQQNVNLATTTDANGRYSFTGLTKGTYTIIEVQQAGWTQTAPQGGSYTLTIDQSGRVYKGKNFGNFRLWNLHGRKYHDINRNRQYDDGEPLLSGWVIELLDMANGNSWQTTTDINGNYSFPPVMPGRYLLREVMQQGWSAWSPRMGFYRLTRHSPGNISYDFGNIQR